MRNRLGILGSLLAALAVLAGCAAVPGSGETNLAFEAQMQVDSGQQFHVSLGARNVGETRYREYQSFNGRMVLRDKTGQELGSIEVATLWELAVGNAGWPASYASKLPAGRYQLTWGARDGDAIEVDFTIVELDGWLYLGEQSIQGTAGAEPDKRQYGVLQLLVDLARVNLAQKLSVDTEAVGVVGIEAVEFPDASLGVPEPGQIYAQVLTPGHSIKLSAGSQEYEYRASEQRLVYVPQEGQVPQGSIKVEEVQVTTGQQIVVRGQSSLADGTCLGSELWANGELQAWWPGDACVPVEKGGWQMVVQLGTGEVPAELDASAQYLLRAYQQNGPDIASVFAFDLAGPPSQEP